MNFKNLRSKSFLSLLFASLFVVQSCGSGQHHSAVTRLFSSDDFLDMDAFKGAIQPMLPAVNPNDSILRQQLLLDTTGDLNASYAYQLSGYKPLWMDASGLKPYGSQLVVQLKALQNDGLNTDKYNLDKLQSEITQIQSKKSLPLDTLVAWDRSFTSTWLMAAEDLLLGAIDITEGDSLWFAKNDASFDGAKLLVASLKDKNELPSWDSFRSDSKVYAQMLVALNQWKQLNSDSIYINRKKEIQPGQHDSTIQWIISRELPDAAVPQNDSLSENGKWIALYQYYHQLKITSKLDSSTFQSLKEMPEDYIVKLKLNLDRLRALPKSIQGEFVWVSIPEMEVNYFRENQVQFHGKVVVGKLSRQTPTLWANMANVVFNPPWGVPPTILKNDVGPGVGRSGGAYLKRKGLHAFDSKGHDVTGKVNGSNYKKYSYRQPPGADNSLGEVKFNLPNPWNIYLHDTPHRDNFSNSYRALSSGCVRVQNPKLLAQVILNSDKFSAEKIDTIISTRKTKYESLKRRLPVYIIYATIAEDSTGTQLRYLKDIYGRDKKMVKFY
jgi:murein L,D-transpeptidase YcbB/YkuD